MIARALFLMAYLAFLTLCANEVDDSAGGGNAPFALAATPVAPSYESIPKWIPLTGVHVSGSNVIARWSTEVEPPYVLGLYHGLEGSFVREAPRYAVSFVITNGTMAMVTCPHCAIHDCNMFLRVTKYNGTSPRLLTRQEFNRLNMASKNGVFTLRDNLVFNPRRRAFVSGGYVLDQSQNMYLPCFARFPLLPSKVDGSYVAVDDFGNVIYTSTPERYLGFDADREVMR